MLFSSRQRLATSFAPALLLFCVIVLLLASLPSSSLAQPVADSPLAPCPDSPNCERVSRAFDQDPDSLFSAAQSALQALGPVSVDTAADAREAHAVYRVALVFKDDVTIAVTADDGGSTLHIRSASRVGYSDLGVNKRRVDSFFDALDHTGSE